MKDTEKINPATVLIVDDNELARKVLEDRVKREGHTVLHAEDGSVVMAMLRTQPVDMILLDIHMPRSTGFEVLAELKADRALAEIPVVVISGGGDQEAMVRCIEMGAVDYLPKPFNQAILRARLMTCISAKRQRDEERRQLQQTRVMSESAAPPGLTEFEGTPDAPKRIGRIVLQRLIGKGSFGQVFLGHHEMLDLDVAVKLVRSDGDVLGEWQARILREARLVARLAHRNIARLLEVGETIHGIYLAYEYVEGGTLEEFLGRKPNRQLDVGEAVGVLRVLTQALVEMHKLNIVHRDIKPANILLTRDGRIKLTDLGLAKQLSDVSGPELTGQHMILGTPLYMSPEQARPRKPVDIRSDLYSLGVVLFEMLTGRPPFERNTPMGLALMHLGSPVPPPRELRGDIPEWLEEVCLKLLEKDPAERYATPEALLEEIRQHTR